jgi:hypothetical protein
MATVATLRGHGGGAALGTEVCAVVFLDPMEEEDVVLHWFTG